MEVNTTFWKKNLKKKQLWFSFWNSTFTWKSILTMGQFTFDYYQFLHAVTEAIFLFFCSFEVLKNFSQIFCSVTNYNFLCVLLTSFLGDSVAKIIAILSPSGCLWYKKRWKIDQITLVSSNSKVEVYYLS